MEILRVLQNKLQVAAFFSKDYEDYFKKEYPVGETVRVRLPQRFLIRYGLGYSPQGLQNLYTNITVQAPFGVDFEWDDVEAALKLGRGEAYLRKQYIEPAASRLATEIDLQASTYAYQHTSNIVGVLGTNPTTIDLPAAARERLIEQACPSGGEKGMIVRPSLTRALVGATTSVFNPTSDIAKQYREGSIGKLQGFDWYETMQVKNHTAGTWGGGSTTTLASAVSSGDSTISVTLSASDVINIGDKICFTGTRAVNPANYQTYTTGSAITAWKTFSVLTSIPSASSGANTITITPTIYGPGSPYQNVDVLPAAGATVTLFPGTTSPQGVQGTVNLALHDSAFAIVGIPLEKPKAVEMATMQRDPDTGMAIRFVRAWDPRTATMINRFDVMIGFGELYNDNAAVAVLAA
jgi:hypothetical protein